MGLTPASAGFVSLLAAVILPKGRMEGRKGEGKTQAQGPGLKSEQQGGPLRFRDLTSQIHRAGAGGLWSHAGEKCRNIENGSGTVPR